MKNSTILGIGLLSVVGVGAYIYLKGKKSTTPISSSPSGTSSAVDSSLGLSTTTQAPAKATIDNVVSAFAETQTENYKKAKVISKEIEVLTNTLRNLESDEKRLENQVGKANNREDNRRTLSDYASTLTQIDLTKNKMSEKTAQANALGYKILPYGEIEKM